MKRFAMMLLFSVFTLACTVPVHAQAIEPTTGRSTGQVVDFILELANVTEKKVTREDLYKDDDEKFAAELEEARERAATLKTNRSYSSRVLSIWTASKL